MKVVNEESEDTGQEEPAEEPVKEVEAPKKHQKKAKSSVVQHDKVLDPHSADAIGNAGDTVGDGADPSIDVDKEKSQSPDHDRQSTSQTEQDADTEASSDQEEDNADQIE